ncbi:hypothetical protein C8F04DRAFT_1263494 [Mycena alexandri]|uniref:Uncharacterized protein n=1 Tax=Mycena alexandri TaxID=1745969 RepID=A0AAD6SS51_9AGAR|nr:hypothetical protein C8F04DRAFT_1263494 [Mycena alexandri]
MAPRPPPQLIPLDSIPGAMGLDETGTKDEIFPRIMKKLTEDTEFADGRRGYTRLAAMDGKTITHKICAVTVCQGDVVNYKNGALTCDDQAHKDWHSQYLNRFARQSFPGVQRVIRKQTAGQSRFGTEAAAGANGPNLHPTLPPLNGVEGADVSHTFRAAKDLLLTYDPMGVWLSDWMGQMLYIGKLATGFIAYNDACNLLRHIVTQNPDDPWIKTSRFIVDSWHYIGHRATDVLCRLWCNPAPTNGSQPDLVTVQVDDNGRTHTTRAFNTETAEQLNAWISGFESQLQQMSATNYDFCVHVIMMLHKEKVNRRILEKGAGLSDEFWDAVEGRVTDED